MLAGDIKRPKSRVGFSMGIPQSWHRRHAMVLAGQLAGQLPESASDALLVLQAMHEMIVTVLIDPGAAIEDRASPFRPPGKVLTFPA